MEANTKTHRAALWDCGVPVDQCRGGILGAHQSGAHGRFKTHGSQDEARACAAAYVVTRNAQKAPTDAILLPPKPLRMKRGKKGRMMVPGFRG